MVFECMKKCGRCCGILLVETAFWETHKDKANAGVIIVPADNGKVLVHMEDMSCPWLDENKRCKIYDERPEVCRNFGTNPELMYNPELNCPYFYHDGTKRSRPARRLLERVIDKRFKKLMKVSE